MKSILVPALQPIYDLINGRVSHYEALARLRDDAAGTGHWPLIQLAERFRFVNHIDVAMLESVLDLLEIETDKVIAVNVSTVTIESRHRDYLAVLDCGSRYANRLMIEITETAPVHDLERLISFVADVRWRGCRVALDDYGSNDSWISADVVKAVKPEFLKLDRIVLDAALEGGNQVVAAAQLAVSVGAEVIAEFVDSREKVEILKASNIRYAQGEMFGMPERYPRILVEFVTVHK